MAMAVNPITSLHEVELLVQTPNAHTLMPMVRDYGWCVDRRGLGRLRVAMTLDLDLQFLSSVAIMRLYREPWDAVTIQNLERAGLEVQRTARRTGGSIQQPADEIGARARAIAAGADADLDMHQVMNQVVGLRFDADAVRQLPADFRVGPEPPGSPPPSM